ncbi:MAG: c-type cytochrome [Sphingobacteriaceae bacterium]|nr:c-type cytochrome [Cytophagaceae bacterium]
MFRKILKGLGLTLAALVVLIALFYGFVWYRTDARANVVYAVSTQTLSIPSDSVSYRLGQHVAQIRGCLGCHGADLGGKAFADEASPLGVLYAANLTNGKGGISYADSDWIRALRHGVGRNGKTLWFMPSHEVCHLSNQEMGALIGFLKTQPPVDRTHPAKALKPLGRMLTFFDQLPMFPAELIDHRRTSYPERITLTANVASGEYLATSCKGCHSPTLRGADAHGPDQPPIPNITSGGNLGHWSAEGFVSLFHTGKTPDGRTLSKYMPVKEFPYSDEELRAIYLYLHQLK